jgi:hypothetical protein
MLYIRLSELGGGVLVAVGTFGEARGQIVASSI